VETDQIDKRFTWLDEQRRKDVEELGRVGEELESLERELRRVADQLQSLAGEQARTSALAAKANRVDATLDQHRLEVGELIEATEARRIAREKQLEELRKAGERQTAQALDAVRSELKAVQEMRDALEGRRQEELRISRSLDQMAKRMEALGKQAEDRGRQSAGLLEARRQDGQRITDIETGLVEQHKRIESAQARLDLAEEDARRLQARLADLDAAQNDLRQVQTLWAEQQAVRQAEFERAWKAQEKRFTEFVEQAEGLAEQLREFTETHRSLKQLEAELAEVVARLERRIEEVSEIQRLAEDRFKQEWAGQQADAHKRWTAFRLESEEQRRDHDRLHQRLADDLRTIQEDLAESKELLQQHLQSEKQRVEESLAAMQQWAAELKRDHRTS
jgi:chromosome segregation ATPase